MKALDHCGPIKHPGMNVTADGKGVYLREPFCFKPAQQSHAWQACWIWLAPDIFPEHQTCPATVFCPNTDFKPKLCLFRKTVQLDSAPLEARALISADTRYRLYINGKMAGRGPAEIGGDYGNTESPDWWFYDTYDLTPLFKEGVNSITIEVMLGPMVQADYSMGHGGLLVETHLHCRDGRQLVIGTDATWRGKPDNGFIMPDQYDARQDPGAWHTVDYDDSRWPNTAVVAGVPGGVWRLTPRRIPPLMETRLLPAEVILSDRQGQARFEDLDALTSDRAPVPALIKPGTPVTFCLRFDREATGYPQIHAEGPAGTVLELGFQEIMGKDDRVGKYILKDGEQTYEGIRLHGFQFLRMTVIFPDGGSCNVPVKLHGVSVNFTSFPVSYRGQFRCSDEKLNSIWEAGRWTTQMCMQAYHLDSPIHQEGLGCTGDYMIEALISYYAFGESRLAQQDILRTAYLLRQKQFKMFHTSYSLLWVQMVKDYWDHTGDLDTVREVFPVIHGLLDLFAAYVGKTGLITEAPNYMFMDWVKVNEYNLHHPPCCIGQGYMTAFYHQALLCAAMLSSAVGDRQSQQEYEERAREARDAFNRELWMPDKDLYCDGKPFLSSVKPNKWMPPDENRVFLSAHTNALAVGCDIAPADKKENIMRRIMQDKTLPPVQPYFMHYVFAALHKAGLFDEYGFSSIRRWQKLLDEHPSSLKEAWDFGDYSHAWSGTPTYQMMARALGISPLEPGFRKINICPVLGDLDWMEGNVPTPFGSVEIRWKRAPEGIRGRIIIPQGIIEAYVTFQKSVATGSRILVNGAPVRPLALPARQNNNLARVNENGVGITIVLRPGAFEITCAQ